MDGFNQRMTEIMSGGMSRRAILRTGLSLAGVTVLAGPARAGFPAAALGPSFVGAMPPYAPPPAPPASKLPIREALLERAKDALDRHSDRIRKRDRMAIVDFAMGSSQPRLHLVDLHAGKVETMLVSHGMGSDPRHTGYLQRFSNEVNSEASCEGAFELSSYYVGKHGPSQRIEGLEATNSNALDRAIVIHGAWYAEPDVIAKHGKLGRSQGCFAVGERALDTVFTHLGQGRMLYAAKV